jgi:hypothetical protein
MPTQTTQPTRSPAADNPFEQFQWKPQPEAERLVRELVDGFLVRCPFARTFSSRLADEAGIRLPDLIDHIVTHRSSVDRGRLRAVGYEEEKDNLFKHPAGLFPPIVLSESLEREVALKVESVADFVSANEVDPAALAGDPLEQERWAVVSPPQDVFLSVVERHGIPAGAEPPRLKPGELWVSLRHAEAFRTRQRRWSNDEEGFEDADRLVGFAIEEVGVDRTCDLFFAAEREYWQRRNRAAQVQKARQDRLGIGWANHDHHTYRSSRKHFARLISVFEKLGFHCRERFYAGRQAGWGAQVLEQPNAGIVIFADVDLSPDELLIDFAHEPLPERQQLGTVGLWCALHGESFLEAGMHHLECQFDFEALRKQLESEAGIRTMKPFTDFPYLRQAFTEGERWPVREERIRRLLERGQITPEQAEAFRTQGAIGSHLENLERNEGFKGFNQTGVSEIIAATDPRKQLSPKRTKGHEE